MHAERSPFKVKRSSNRIVQTDTPHEAMEELALEFIDANEAKVWEFNMLVEALEAAYMLGRRDAAVDALQKGD